MEITNEERREVAENLRSMVDYDCRYSEQFYELLTETVMNDWDFHSFPDTAERLADLIDYPVCIIYHPDPENEDIIRCNRCNKTLNRTWEPFRFCPNCGAEVVK